MKVIMKNAVNQVYKLLRLKATDRMTTSGRLPMEKGAP
jgi:hypothetical protein